jgi:hypothetical protein
VSALAAIALAGATAAMLGGLEDLVAGPEGASIMPDAKRNGACSAASSAATINAEAFFAAIALAATISRL